MQNSMLKLEMLKEGRSIRLPILLIFYNSILAFVTILFVFFHNESKQIGFLSGRSSFLAQFLILTSLQILAVFVLIPFSVSAMEDSDRAVAGQFMVIPDVIRYHIIARISTLVCTNLLILLSSLPIIALSCIYSGIKLLGIVRLLWTVAVFSFWGGSIALFFFSMNKRSVVAFAETIFTYFMMSVGILLFLEVVRNASLSMSRTGEISSAVTTLCLAANLFNPMTVFVGYYENFSGNVPAVTSYFGNFGIDVTTTTFSYFYFKAATLICILVGIGFLWLAVRFYSSDRQK